MNFNIVNGSFQDGYLFSLVSRAIVISNIAYLYFHYISSMHNISSAAYVEMVA